MAPRKVSTKSETVASLKERRAKQHEEIVSIVNTLEDCIAKARDMRSQYELLSSVSLGLYDELDKLSKKAPAEPVTDLVLNQVNDAIRAIRELAKDDHYVQRLKEFVAAGDNPEQRDVVVVLRQLRQGLERFDDTIDPRIENLTNKQREATTIQLALQLYMDGENDIKSGDMQDYGFIPSKGWFTGYLSDQHFDWNRLDRIDLHTYFPPCE